MRKRMYEHQEKSLKTIPSIYAIQTGLHWFDYEEPQTSTMDLGDIALSLSNICRWGGHCRPFFSVAQHAILVADLAYADTGSHLAALYALHHDDHEAVRGDIPTPRKRFLKKHNMLFPGEERAEDEFIYGTLLGLEWPMPEDVAAAVKRADLKALFTERKHLKPPMKWHENDYAEVPPLGNEFEAYLGGDHEYWEDLYLKTHERLTQIVNEKVV